MCLFIIYYLLFSVIDKEAIELANRVPFTKDLQPKDLTLNQYHTYADVCAYLFHL
jgi:hypothetical protein